MGPRSNLQCEYLRLSGTMVPPVNPRANWNRNFFGMKEDLVVISEDLLSLDRYVPENPRMVFESCPEIYLPHWLRSLSNSCIDLAKVDGHFPKDSFTDAIAASWLA